MAEVDGLLRWDECEEMDLFEEAGCARGSEEWMKALACYRASMRWHTIDVGLPSDVFLPLHTAALRRVFSETMGYELPE